MKASFKTILCLFFASALLISCEECGEPTITPITEDDAKWLVYNNQDTIRYTSNTNEQVKFLLSNAFTENVPGEGYSISDDCIEEMNTQAGRIVQDVKQKWPGMATYILKSPNDLRVSLVVQGGPAIEIDENNPTYPTKRINEVNYLNVFEVNKDSTKVGDLKRIFFNRDSGFIRVEYYGGRTLQLQ